MGSDSVVCKISEIFFHKIIYISDALYFILNFGNVKTSRKYMHIP